MSQLFPVIPSFKNPNQVTDWVATEQISPARGTQGDILRRIVVINERNNNQLDETWRNISQPNIGAITTPSPEEYEPLEYRNFQKSNRRFGIANLVNHGVIADGEYHPLSETFSTLAEAQEKYPSAVSLEDSTDWAALQSLIDKIRNSWLAGVQNNGQFPDLDIKNSPPTEIFLGDGVITVNRTIEMKGLTLRGTGQGYYVVVQNGFASSTNTVKGTVIQAIEGASGFQGTEVINANPDNSNLTQVSIDGNKLNKGSVSGVNLYAIINGQKYNPDDYGRGHDGGRFFVIDPDDPMQFRADFFTEDLPPIFVEDPEYEEFLHAWPGRYTTLSNWSFSIASGIAPPGLVLESNGRLHGTFTPTQISDIKTYNFTVNFNYEVDGQPVKTISQDYSIGCVTPYIEDFEFPVLTEDRAYSIPLRVVNQTGTASYSVSLQSDLPGLAVSSDGVVTITPAINSSGDYTVEFTVEYIFNTTATGVKTTRRYPIQIVDQSVAPTFANLDDIKRVWKVGQARSLPIITQGGTGALTYSIDLTQSLAGFENQNPGYPQEVSPGIWSPGPGITFDGATGIISGTPTQSNRYTFYLKVQDQNNRVRIEPVILTPLPDPSTAPKFFSRGYPLAVKGQPYSYQVICNNLGTGTIHAIPLPTGLSMSTSGLITGTPVGMTHTHGLLWRFSAIASELTIRNFHSTSGLASSANRTIINSNPKQSNLHRLKNFIIKNCRYGLDFAQVYDSHIYNGYIAGCFIGINLQSGAAAVTYRNIRIEFIGRYGVQASVANENQFIACYFDTCGSSSIFAEKCKNLMISNCIFFRSGRLIPGRAVPHSPQANESRSNHIRLSECDVYTISDNLTLIGHHAEGVSRPTVRFAGHENFARPAVSLSEFACTNGVVTGNNFTGCCNSSYSNGGGEFIDKLTVYSNNQFNYAEYGEPQFNYADTHHNYFVNGDFSINSRQSTYSVVGPTAQATTTEICEFWQLVYGTHAETVNVSLVRNDDKRLPFGQYLRIQKPKIPTAIAGNTQNLVLQNYSASRDIRQLAGRTVIISYYAKSNIADTGLLLCALNLTSGDSQQTVDLGGAAVTFGANATIRPKWRRFTNIIRCPRLDKYIFENNFNSFVTARFFLDDADKDYDLCVSGFKLQLAPDGLLPSSFSKRTREQELQIAQSRNYMKSLPTSKYFGETGANFTNAGTVQIIANGTQQPQVYISFPVPLDADPSVTAGVADKVKIRSYRAAATRSAAGFSKANQIGAATEYDVTVNSISRYGMNVAITNPLPVAGTVILFHWEYDASFV